MGTVRIMAAIPIVWKTRFWTMIPSTLGSTRLTTPLRNWVKTIRRPIEVGGVVSPIMAVVLAREAIKA